MTDFDATIAAIYARRPFSYLPRAGSFRNLLNWVEGLR